MAKFRNKKMGRSECLYILTDQMDPYTLSVYELIKSFGGYDTFDLTVRQIASARKMSKSSAASAFKILKETGVIKLVKKTGYFEGDEYEVCDEWLAFQMDPKMEYNKKRKGILDTQHKIWKQHHKN